MPEQNPSAEPVVYQLRVVLRSISPLIWRRLLVSSDNTIADLHATLQTVFGWSGEHLHRVVIHGRSHGPESLVDPRHVRLADLGLRAGERFLYEYDFTDGWQHDVRVERRLPLELADSTHAASVGDGECRPRIAAGHGRSWSCASGTRC